MKHPAFYTRLTFSSLKRNMSAWLPYLLSVTGTVIMLLIMRALSASPTLEELYGGRTIQRTLSMGVMVAQLFAVIFILYTHSFLLKRRKQEFGLFTVLGLEKRHLGRVLAIETLFTALLSTALGLLLGALLCKLMYLMILRLLGAAPQTPLAIPADVYLKTALEFLIIHALTLVITLRQVHTNNPIELLRGGAQGEKPMRNRRVLAVIGLGLLAAGYALSLTVQNAMQSIGTFFLAVLLVILGTYALFLWGSVAGLKAMQGNKKFYYQAKNFPVVAGMVHRMKRNAVGLATICILSTMVLVMVAATGSLFLGREDALLSRGRDARFTFIPVEKDDVPPVWNIIRKEAEKLNIPLSGESGYRNAKMYVPREEGQAAYQEGEGNLFQSISFTLVPWEDFAPLYPKEQAPAPGEALYFSAYGKDLPEQYDKMGIPLRMVRRLEAIRPLDEERQALMETYTVILLEEDLDALGRAAPDGFAADLRYNVSFDTGDVGTQEAWTLVNNTQNKGAAFLMDKALPLRGKTTTFGSHVALERADFNAMYGGLLFVAVFLGALFIMALVLIIYYKQVSEGYEDRQGFRIMRKVGMSDEEVRAAIKSQVLLVFFLPLLMAGLHMLAAFNITLKVLEMLMLTNAGLFALVSLGTFLLFALFYLAVYIKTTGSYYKVVNSAA